MDHVHVLGVDVREREVGVGEFRDGENVAEEPAAKPNTARADERNFNGHEVAPLVSDESKFLYRIGVVCKTNRTCERHGNNEDNHQEHQGHQEHQEKHRRAQMLEEPKNELKWFLSPVYFSAQSFYLFLLVLLVVSVLLVISVVVFASFADT
jgi:hypothetical protein